MKRTFEIECPEDYGPLWMNQDNLLICLTNTCRNTRFTVRDVTGDGAPSDPVSAGPIGVANRREAVLGAVARGWCAPENSSKVMDPDLASAITDEICAAIA